uniref:Uncharacterized protein n=1 Tax=Arundo donax TaxID=35708 RepID=A0A0A8Y8L1_ARUDO
MCDGYTLSKSLSGVEGIGIGTNFI